MWALSVQLKDRGSTMATTTNAVSRARCFHSPNPLIIRHTPLGNDGRLEDWHVRVKAISASVQYVTGSSGRLPSQFRGPIICPAPGQRRAEKHCQDLVPSKDTDKFMYGAVDQNQHNQENLDGPEMRPHDLREQFLVAGH